MNTGLETRPSKWPHRSHDIAGVPIVATSPSEAAIQICRMALDESVSRHVHLVNAYTIALADADPEYRRILVPDGIVLPDGRPLMLISRLFRHLHPLKQIRGPQLFLDVFDIGRTHGIKHYLLGSSPEVLQSLQENLHAKYPGVDIAGAYSPPFRDMTDDEIRRQDQMICDSSAHIVWVGLGTPKQDREARRLAANLPIVAVAVGAAFDFAAGSVKEAPSWMRYLCLEWAYRLWCEPSRLWRRYVFGNLRFLKAVVANLNKG